MKKVIRIIDGEGGRATSRLIKELFLKRLSNPLLKPLNDSAVAELTSSRIAFTTDAFVVDPLEFPGGDIGKLSVCGTVNDLAAAGAKPVLLSAAFILEEGLELERLERFVESMAETAGEANSIIACGDTKVVPHGKGDGVYITTTGVGVLPGGDIPEPKRIATGDAIVISGPIAQHAAAIIAIRENLRADPPIASDCAPLSNMVLDAMAVSEIHAMRDPTRGGLGGVLIELARQSGKRFVIRESEIPINEAVENICELYGYDPLFMACEGRMVFILPETEVDSLLVSLRKYPYGKGANRIATVEEGSEIIIETKSGGVRRLVPPEGAPLPRIC